MWTTESIKQDVSLLQFFTELFNKWLSPWINSPSIRETLRKRFSTEPCGYKVLLENKDYSVSFQKRHDFDFCRGHMKYRPQSTYIYASPLFFPPMAFHSCTSQWVLWTQRAYSQVYHLPSVRPAPLGHGATKANSRSCEKWRRSAPVGCRGHLHLGLFEITHVAWWLRWNAVTDKLLWIYVHQKPWTLLFNQSMYLPNTWRCLLCNLR